MVLKEGDLQRKIRKKKEKKNITIRCNHFDGWVWSEG